MEADLYGDGLDEIRAAIRAANAQSPYSVPSLSEYDSASKTPTLETDLGGMIIGDVPAPLPSPEPRGDETVCVAGKNLDVGSLNGSSTDPVESPVSGNLSTTKQLWLRLPEVFATLLKRQPASYSGSMFMAVVFGQIGKAYAPIEFFAAVEHLQRISMLLQCALERGLSNDLVTRVVQVITMINQVCRKTSVDYVRMRLRLPNEYANALLALTPKDRERIIRLAVHANAASISLQQLVIKASVLYGLRKRLLVKHDSVVVASLEADVRELLTLICSLHITPHKGGLP